MLTGMRDSLFPQLRFQYARSGVYNFSNALAIAVSGHGLFKSKSTATSVTDFVFDSGRFLISDTGAHGLGRSDR